MTFPIWLGLFSADNSDTSHPVDEVKCFPNVRHSSCLVGCVRMNTGCVTQELYHNYRDIKRCSKVTFKQNFFLQNLVNCSQQRVSRCAGDEFSL